MTCAIDRVSSSNLFHAMAPRWMQTGRMLWSSSSRGKEPRYLSSFSIIITKTPTALKYGWQGSGSSAAAFYSFFPQLWNHLRILKSKICSEATTNRLHLSHSGWVKTSRWSLEWKIYHQRWQTGRWCVQTAGVAFAKTCWCCSCILVSLQKTLLLWHHLAPDCGSARRSERPRSR